MGYVDVVLRIELNNLCINRLTCSFFDGISRSCKNPNRQRKIVIRTFKKGRDSKCFAKCIYRQMKNDLNGFIKNNFGLGYI